MDPIVAPHGDPERVAVVGSRGDPVTYAGLDTRVRHLAGLLTGAGLHPGDRIATLTANSIDQVVLFFACARAELVLVPLSQRATAAELGLMLADAGPLLLATDGPRADLAASAIAGLDPRPRRVRLGAGGIEAEVPTADTGAGTRVAEHGSGAVLLLYTSGSSGRPKGVPLTQANCWSTNQALGARFPITGDDTVLMVLPQFHVAAWNVQPLLAWQNGARVVIVPEFDPAAVLARIEQESVTMMMGVPTTYELLAEHQDFTTTDLGSLRTAVVGGAPVDVSLGTAWARRGIRLWAGYGLTEAGPNVLCEPQEVAPTRWLMPYDGVQVRLGDRGELNVRGPGVFSGYWRDDDSTRAVLRDGWLATGDLAERSGEGRYRLTGRASEKYISGGENVHPAEVEQALRRDPSVAEAAVVGVPDDRWGESGVAFVVLRPGHDADGDRLRARSRGRLAGYKVPRAVIVVPELPLTGSGKVDKQALRARIDKQALRAGTDKQALRAGIKEQP